MNFTLRVWRQSGPKESGRFEEYPAHDIPADASFLEMLDIVNEGLIEKNVEPIAFDHDCREGICGTCSITINGISPWSRQGHDLSALHAQVPRSRCDHGRAISSGAVSGVA